MANKKPKKEQRQRPPQDTVELDPRFQDAINAWTLGHNQKRAPIYRLGAFAYMSMSEAERVRLRREYDKWADEGFESSWLDWPAR